MAYRFTEKTSCKQQQSAYALYMILSSYFNKSTCRNKLMETSLYLYYQELPLARQESLEEKVIADVEKELEDLIPVLDQMHCKISIFRQGGEYHLLFKTGFETVSAVVDPKGRYRIQALKREDTSLQMSA